MNKLKDKLDCLASFVLLAVIVAVAFVVAVAIEQGPTKGKNESEQA